MSENGGYRRLEIGSKVMCGFCFRLFELRSIKSHFEVCPAAIKYVEMCRKVGKDILDKALVKPGDISTCGHCTKSRLVHCMSEHHKRCKKAVKEKEEIEKKIILENEVEFLKVITCEVCCVSSCTSVTMYGYLNC
jgi:hypothetical protein